MIEAVREAKRRGTYLTWWGVGMLLEIRLSWSYLEPKFGGMRSRDGRSGKRRGVARGVKSLTASEKTPGTEEMGGLGKWWKMAMGRWKEARSDHVGLMYLSNLIICTGEFKAEAADLQFYENHCGVTVNRFLQGSNQDYFQKLRLSLVPT